MIIKVKKFQDFKDNVKQMNLAILYRIEEDKIFLYYDMGNIYCWQGNIVDPENVIQWLETNFDEFFEVDEL